MDACSVTSKRKIRRPWWLVVLFSALLLPAQQQQEAHHHLFFHVKIAVQSQQLVSGRLLIFLAPGTGASTLNVSVFDPTAASAAAEEVHDVPAGGVVDIDTDRIAYPAGFSALRAGNYQAQAILDVNHTYNYSGLTEGDLKSEVLALPHFDPQSSSGPSISLTSIIPAPPVDSLLPSVHEEDFTSPSLSAFYHRPIQLRALVVEPPHYADSPNRRYPACYFTPGFNGTFRHLHSASSMIGDNMASGRMPPMFWVLLDESLPTGTHEFADSANNGPWGHALTAEFIPYLESRYRLDRRASARFLNGHSSGGWATLWLQVTYPKMFGGTWSTSPDPSDFHDFTGVDLYAPHANLYHRQDGTLYPLVRENGRVVATIQQFATLESVLGPYGGQFASFDWVFSPKGPDGAPLEMFDRNTGEVSPSVMEGWKRYDIALTIANNWRRLAPNLNGKIHMYVGTADTFYLDGSAHKLDAVLKQVGANAEVLFLKGRTHFDVYRVGNDPTGLFRTIAQQMYASWQRAKQHRPTSKR
jgi:S-formylglutathione hydrolase FrmB